MDQDGVTVADKERTTKEIFRLKLLINKQEQENKVGELKSQNTINFNNARQGTK